MSLLRIDNLTKNFGGLTAINDVSLNIEEGEVVGLIGPNGAGKTTLFNLISGYLRPDRGNISFDGQNLVDLRANQICKMGIGRTFQIVQPFSGLKVINNVMIGAFNKTDDLKVSEERSLRILNSLGLSDRKDHLVSGLPIADRKRLELARALATQPRLLLLDEVAAGLNPKEVAEIIKILKKIKEGGVTLFMIEHVLKAIASLADRIVVINFGTKICEGRPADVFKDPNVIKAYLGEEYQVARST
jgi:branched-chain amino acid transport system ATP-binding protein